MATTLTPQGIEVIFGTEYLSILGTEYIKVCLSVPKLELLILLVFRFLYYRISYSVLKIKNPVPKKEVLLYMHLLVYLYIFSTEYIVYKNLVCLIYKV